MLIIIKAKATDNIIGLKEDIAARLDGVADIERIDVESEVSDNEQKKRTNNHKSPCQVHS